MKIGRSGLPGAWIELDMMVPDVAAVRSGALPELLAVSSKRGAVRIAARDAGRDEPGGDPDASAGSSGYYGEGDVAR